MEKTPEFVGSPSGNTAAEIAWASFVFSLVPYLGILFIPLTFAAGIFGYVSSSRRAEIGGEMLSLISLGLSIAVLAVQALLWWLLYVIPQQAI
jgi:hypothetical protein